MGFGVNITRNLERSRMETKLCKDCKHLRLDMGYQFGAPPICEHPDAPIDPVYGRKNATCQLMRSTNCLIQQCGEDGSWFEQRIETEPQPALTASYGDMAQWDLPRTGFLERIFGRWL